MVEDGGRDIGEPASRSHRDTLVGCRRATQATTWPDGQLVDQAGAKHHQHSTELGGHQKGLQLRPWPELDRQLAQVPHHHHQTAPQGQFYRDGVHEPGSLVQAAHWPAHTH